MPSIHWGLSNCQIERTIVDCRNWAFLPMTDFDRWAKATDWWMNCSHFFRKPPLTTLPGQLSRQARCLFPGGSGGRASRAQGVQCCDSATGFVMSAVKTLSCDLFLLLWMHIRRSKVVAATLSVQKCGLCKNWRMLKVWKSEKDKWQQVMASHTGHRCCEARSDSCFLGCWQREAPCHDELLGCFVELKWRQTLLSQTW